jgi:hypothetical protein
MVPWWAGGRRARRMLDELLRPSGGLLWAGGRGGEVRSLGVHPGCRAGCDVITMRGKRLRFDARTERSLNRSIHRALPVWSIDTWKVTNDTSSLHDYSSSELSRARCHKSGFVDGSWAHGTDGLQRTLPHIPETTGTPPWPTPNSRAMCHTSGALRQQSNGP